MQKCSYDELYQTEDNHWYFDGRRKLVDIYLKYIQNEIGQCLRILDVGSGTGGMFGLLKKYGQITGLELSEYAASLSHNKYPEVTLKIGSANNLSELFPKSSFDLVVFMNVLYHRWILDDIEVLKQATNIIKPGGFIILVEPAFNCIYRNNDRICYGVRRYSQSRVSHILSASGFNLVKSTYFNSISFLPLLLITLLQRFSLREPKNKSSELRPLPKFINRCFKWMMLLERLWIITFKKMYFGASILTLGKKI